MINAIAVDDDDRVFISDGKLAKVLVFDPNHKIAGQINEGLVDPLGLAIDSERRLLYVVDTTRLSHAFSEYAGRHSRQRLRWLRSSDRCCSRIFAAIPPSLAEVSK